MLLEDLLKGLLKDDLLTDDLLEDDLLENGLLMDEALFWTHVPSVLKPRTAVYTSESPRTPGLRGTSLR